MKDKDLIKRSPELKKFSDRMIIARAALLASVPLAILSFHDHHFWIGTMMSVSGAAAGIAASFLYFTFRLQLGNERAYLMRYRELQDPLP